MYTYMCIYIHIHIYIYIYIYIYLCIDITIYAQTNTQTYAHTFRVTHTCIFTLIHTYRILPLNRDGSPRSQRCQPDVKGRQPPRQRRVYALHNFRINDRHTLMAGLRTGTGTDREGAEFWGSATKRNKPSSLIKVVPRNGFHGRDRSTPTQSPFIRGVARTCIMHGFILYMHHMSACRSAVF